jgi:hypothetical protein
MAMMQARIRPAAVLLALLALGIGLTIAHAAPDPAARVWLPLVAPAAGIVSDCPPYLDDQGIYRNLHGCDPPTIRVTVVPVTPTPVPTPVPGSADDVAGCLIEPWYCVPPRQGRP